MVPGGRRPNRKPVSSATGAAPRRGAARSAWRGQATKKGRRPAPEAAPPFIMAPCSVLSTPIWQAAPPRRPIWAPPLVPPWPARGGPAQARAARSRFENHPVGASRRNRVFWQLTSREIACRLKLSPCRPVPPSSVADESREHELPSVRKVGGGGLLAQASLSLSANQI